MVAVLASGLIAAALLAARQYPKPKPRTVNYQASIQQGLDYLDLSGQVSPLQWLLVDYLQRRFALDPRFSAFNRPIAVPGDAGAAAEFRVYQRIAYPAATVGSLPTTPDPTSRLVMQAMECDRIPLPSDFRPQLSAQIDAGGYALTHMAFSLELMQENGCRLSDDQLLETRLIPGLMDLAGRPSVAPDLRYEATAMLAFIGRGDLIQPEWIRQMALEQNADGGWPGDGPGVSNDHATVLAVWALLAHTNPGRPNQPMLRRPGHS
jgi:hypothetical protein